MKDIRVIRNGQQSESRDNNRDPSESSTNNVVRTMENPLTSIIVLNYNGSQELRTLFDSIQKTTYHNREVIMVDNGSSDKSIDYTRKHFPSVRIIDNGRNVGAAEGFNVGIAHSNGKYFALLSPGMEVDPDWLHPLVSVLESDDSVAAVDSWYIDYNDRLRFDRVVAAGRYADRFGNIRNHAAGELTKNHERSIKRIFAGMTLMRKDIFKNLGPFDPDFFFGYEDMDLFLRINLAGYKVLSIPSSRIFHKSGASSERGIRRPGFYYLEKRNRLISLVKNLPTKSLVFAFPVVFFEYISYLAFWTLKGNKRNVTELVRSLIWFLEKGNLRGLLAKRREYLRRKKERLAPLRSFMVPYCGDLLRLFGGKYRTDESSNESLR